MSEPLPAKTFRTIWVTPRLRGLLVGWLVVALVLGFVARAAQFPTWLSIVLFIAVIGGGVVTLMLGARRESERRPH